MRLSLKQLKKMTVKTMSDMVLGSVTDIIFDTDGQSVVQYEVKHGFFEKEYLIHRDQVSGFEEYVMRVYDTAAPQEKKKKERLDIPVHPEPVAMREE
ncbi:MAG: PRC-barrel domain-containing protein [Candidatus Magasanikbacteria bacterium]|jgi:sporulation protein YlmC with PRC-barrel domain|nr:PRC-barrel domain-containing protein [Candidatus Magasanikbacteria bacterium]MBT4071157.1 PRC-barrel domain-containing protein [Candidatus Magasanikbacteria bacterium]